MNNNKKSTLVISIIAVASFASFGLINKTITPNDYTKNFRSSLYLNDKNIVPCNDNCTEIIRGYSDAESNDDCAVTYDSVPTDDYSLGVYAWTWDNCAYGSESQI